MANLYAITMLTGQVLRDHKLKELQGIADEIPSWNQLLKVSNVKRRRMSIIPISSYNCKFTKNKCRLNLSSASRWKTRKGAENVIKAFQSDEKYKSKLTSQYGTWKFMIVDIKKDWNDSLTSQIEYNKEYVQKKIQKLEKQIII